VLLRGSLVIAPEARLVHHRSPVGRSSEHHLRREVRADVYLYGKHWRRGVTNRLCLGWLLLGYGVQATLASLFRRNREPWRSLFRGVREGRRLVAALPGSPLAC
jgi:hypothetical protein